MLLVEVAGARNLPINIFMSQFSNFAKSASDWLEKKLAGGICLQNTRDELQNTELCTELCTGLYQSPTKALHEPPYEALQKLYQRLCNTSAHPVYWPRSEWST
jgi:hypothetical protein